MLQMEMLGLEEALRSINATIARARELNRPVAVAVVDKAGGLIGAARMDERAVRYIHTAIRKAYSAAVFERDTAGLFEWFQEKPTSQLDWGADPLITTLAGGVTAVSNGQVVGGVGVAGGGPQDEELADFALNALGLELTHRRGWS